MRWGSKEDERNAYLNVELMLALVHQNPICVEKNAQWVLVFIPWAVEARPNFLLPAWSLIGQLAARIYLLWSDTSFPSLFLALKISTLSLSLSRFSHSQEHSSPRINTGLLTCSTPPLPAPSRFEMSTTHRASTLLACLSRPGPSRLAKQLKPCQACAEHLRHASTSTESVEASEDAEPADASPSAGESSTTRGQGYDAWLRSVGRQYKDSPTNGPNWLGGHVVSLSPALFSCPTLTNPLCVQSPTLRTRHSVHRLRSRTR